MLFDEYALIKIEIARLETKAKAMVPEVIAEMQTLGKSKIDNALGTGTITMLKAWKYPANIVKAEDKLKADKAKAQSTGDATYEETPSLRFISTKL